MNKTQFVDAVAKAANLTKKDAEAAINAFVAVVSDELKNGEKVQLVGFGTFEAKTCAARTCRNPKTGATVEVPATKRPTFSAGKALKDSVK